MLYINKKEENTFISSSFVGVIVNHVEASRGSRCKERANCSKFFRRFTSVQN